MGKKKSDVMTGTEEVVTAEEMAEFARLSTRVSTAETIVKAIPEQIKNLESSMEDAQELLAKHLKRFADFCEGYTIEGRPDGSAVWVKKK